MVYSSPVSIDPRPLPPAPLDGPSAAILLIGDELLSGKVADENAVFLTRELRALGVVTRRIEVIPDDEAEIAGAVRRLAAGFTHVFTSGGVGATHDDVTFAAVASAFDMSIRRDAELVALIRKGLGELFTERELRMADIPDGARLEYGTDNTGVWPVVAIANVYVLPGVPVILRRKFALLREHLRTSPIFSRAVFLSATEGQIADDLDAVVEAFPDVAIGSYPHHEAKDYKVKITLDARDSRRLDAAVTALCERIPHAVVRTD